MMIIFTVAILSACGDDTSNSSDELLMLEVEFIVPDSVEVGETAELKAEVTYGDELESDAEVKFEVWETEDEERENSVTFDANNNGDGTYTADFTFEKETVYEMYAHTDAHHIHTMPRKEVPVGNAAE